MKIASVSERRPNSEDYQSFPSQHAAESFAAAYAISQSCSKLTRSFALTSAGASMRFTGLGQKAPSTRHRCGTIHRAGDQQGLLQTF